MGTLLKLLVASLCIISTLSADIDFSSNRRNHVSKELFREMINAGLYRDIENDGEALRAKLLELRAKGRVANDFVSPFDMCESSCNITENACSCDCATLTSNITLLMQNISNQIGNGNKNFQHVTLTNINMIEIGPNAFGDITAANLNLDRVTGLQRISTTAFNSLSQRLTNFYMYGDLGFELVNQPPDYNLFRAFNSLSILQVLEFALGFHISQEIPDGAFSETQNSLVRITFESESTISRIGNGAFAGLTNLSNIDLSFMLVNTIAAQAFRFASATSTPLTVHLEFASLSDQSIQPGAFTGRNRVIHLIITGNYLTTLPENVFGDLINNEPRGFVYVANNPLNCNNTQQYAWLFSNLDNSKERVLNPTCTDGRSLWDLEPGTDPTTVGTTGSTGTMTGSTGTMTGSTGTSTGTPQSTVSDGTTVPTPQTTAFASNLSVNNLLLLALSLLSLKMIFK